ncbi:MAG: J domain-containing protein, partial [Acidimicrobiia bacterium]|nr:J domain-containing protein [Acidimicrobiia bacterium]
MTRVRTREWSSTDYYAVLGVAPDATPGAIDARYRELAKVLHPDRTADLDDQERFKQMSTAYSALRDPGTRAAYDEFRDRIASGTLYSTPSRPAPSAGRADHFAPPRVLRRRPPMPAWLRTTVAGVLGALGLAAVLWAAFGNLPSPASADTPIAVQITLVIMAAKFFL